MSRVGYLLAALLCGGCHSTTSTQGHVQVGTSPRPVLRDSYLEIPMSLDLGPLLTEINSDPDLKSGSAAGGTFRRTTDFAAAFGPGHVFITANLHLDLTVVFGCGADVDSAGARIDYSWSVTGDLVLAASAHFSHFSTNCIAGGAVEAAFTQALAKIVKDKVQPKLDAIAATAKGAMQDVWTALSSSREIASDTLFEAPALMELHPSDPYLTPIAGDPPNNRLIFGLGMSSRPRVTVGDPPSAGSPMPAPAIRAGTSGAFALDIAASVTRAVVAAALRKNLVGKCAGVPCRVFSINDVVLEGYGPQFSLRLGVRGALGRGCILLTGREVFSAHSWQLRIADIEGEAWGSAVVGVKYVVREASDAFSWPGFAGQIEAIRARLASAIEKGLGGRVHVSVTAAEPILGLHNEFCYGDPNRLTVFVRLEGRIVPP